MFTGGAPANGLTAAAVAAGNAYASKMAGYFLPDVMRIDTSGTSGYAAQLCNGAADGSPLLCGGRLPTDDVIDITYGFLFNGDATASVPQLTDRVTYAGSNAQQGHTALRSEFPWIPKPHI
jgi:hypothetical protein